MPIHDYGEIDGQQFVDMRLIEGTDLSKLLKRQRALSAPRAVAIVRQTASALDAAHAVGVIHGDVKPENILITREDIAYLVDLGITDAAPHKGVARVVGSAVADLEIHCARTIYRPHGKPQSRHLCVDLRAP